MASRRQYLTQAELATYANITITDPVEADIQISEAEELIDAYLGPQDQFFDSDFSNVVEGLSQGPAAGSDGQHTMILESRHANVFMVNFFTYCEVEILGGAGNGQRTIISASTYPNTYLTFRDPLTTAIDKTSFYRLYQLGKFPRKADTYLDSINPPNPIYYKNIPEALKRAVAAQVEFYIAQGVNFFRSADVFVNNERIGDYSYDKARDGSGTGIGQLLAPKTKWHLRGLVNRRGVMAV